MSQSFLQFMRSFAKARFVARASVVLGLGFFSINVSAQMSALSTNQQNPGNSAVNRMQRAANDNRSKNEALQGYGDLKAGPGGTAISGKKTGGGDGGARVQALEQAVQQQAQQINQLNQVVGALTKKIPEMQTTVKKLNDGIRSLATQIQTNIDTLQSNIETQVTAALKASEVKNQRNQQALMGQIQQMLPLLASAGKEDQSGVADQLKALGGAIGKFDKKLKALEGAGSPGYEDELPAEEPTRGEHLHPHVPAPLSAHEHENFDRPVDGLERAKMIERMHEFLSKRRGPDAGENP